MPGATPCDIDDTELPALESRVGAEHLDDRFGLGALLQLAEHEHLVGMRPVYRGLARCHAMPGYHDGLYAWKNLIVAIDARG